LICVDICDTLSGSASALRRIHMCATHCRAVRVHYDSFTCATHCQAVRVHYDPVKVTYLDLLEVFFANVDVTQLNQQGLYDGTQVLATHCNTLHHTASHFNTPRGTAIHCNAQRRTGTHCTTLGHFLETKRALLQNPQCMCT